MLIKSISLTLLTLVNHAHGAAQKASDIFQVDFKTDASGGCKYVGEDAMDNYVKDCLTLANAGIQLMNDYPTPNSPARRLVDAYFKAVDPGVVTADAVNDARENFLDVASFLEGKGTMNSKPYLFCQSTWVERQTMNDPWRNAQGATEEKTNKNGAKTTLKNKDVVYMNDGKTKALKWTKTPFPYWSPRHRAYLFDRSYTNPAMGYCSMKGHFGVTQHDLQPAAITICPVAWNTQKGLREIPITEMSQADTGNTAIMARTTKIESSTPTAATLFHELFHLVLGKGETTPEEHGIEVYDWATMRELSSDDLFMNPETYTWAAVAYDITSNDTPVNGQRVEFHSNYAMRG